MNRKEMNKGFGGYSGYNRNFRPNETSFGSQVPNEDEGHKNSPISDRKKAESGQNGYGNGEENNSNWTDNPRLKNMDPAKLKMLNDIAMQGSQKGINDLLPFLMSSVSKSQNKSGGMHFSPQEMDTIIEVLKMGKSPEETARINRMLQLIKMMH